MYSSLILIIVLTEVFPAPPVLLYAYYSRLNFAMLGVATLKDVHREFYVWGVLKNICQKFAQVCVKMSRAALLPKGCYSP